MDARQNGPSTPSPTQPTELFGESTDPAGLARKGSAVLDVVLALVVFVWKFAEYQTDMTSYRCQGLLVQADCCRVVQSTCHISQYAIRAIKVEPLKKIAADCRNVWFNNISWLVNCTVCMHVCVCVCTFVLSCSKCIKH